MFDIAFVLEMHAQFSFGFNVFCLSGEINTNQILVLLFNKQPHGSKMDHNFSKKFRFKKRHLGKNRSPKLPKLCIFTFKTLKLTKAMTRLSVVV